ncbi:MAG: hypothetical protein ABIS47_12790 [Acidimicrobiales bacterium]
MPPRGRDPVRRRACGAALGVVALVLAGLVVPGSAGAQAAPSIQVAPTCAVGNPVRIDILGQSWQAGKPVAISVRIGDVTTSRGTVIPQATSPVSQRPGSFSFVASVATTSNFDVIATQGKSLSTATVGVDTNCGYGISVKPPCLSGPGTVRVTGFGFPSNTRVPVDVDPLGNAEAATQQASTDGNGSFAIALALPAPTGPIPIVASRRFSSVPGGGDVVAVFVSLAVAFVDPCPPPPSTTTTRTTPGTTGTVPGTTSTTGTTTTVVVPPTVPPPVGVPPVTPPGTPASISISPRTLRPGRCAVLVISGAPPSVPVVARFDDGPPVNAQTRPDGGAVMSICVPHDAGNRLGPVGVVLTLGSFGPAPVFTELRVPARPQPPLLQAGADDRRS